MKNNIMATMAARAMADAVEFMRVSYYDKRRCLRTLFFLRESKHTEIVKLYPITPKGVAMITGYVLELDMNLAELMQNGLDSVLKILATRMDTLLKVVAVATLPSSEQADIDTVLRQATRLGNMLSAEQVVQAFTHIFLRVDYESFANSIRLIARVSATAAPSFLIEKEKQ